LLLSPSRRETGREVFEKVQVKDAAEDGVTKSFETTREDSSAAVHQGGIRISNKHRRHLDKVERGILECGAVDERRS
jgi:hypothetical protein